MTPVDTTDSDQQQHRSLCPFCHGSGRCGKCRGVGTQAARPGWFRRPAVVPCTACEGSGTCPLCKGGGTVDSR